MEYIYICMDLYALVMACVSMYRVKTPRQVCSTPGKQVVDRGQQIRVLSDVATWHDYRCCY